MFPHINHINDLLPYIDGNRQFRVQEQPNGTTVVCYMLQDEDTFKGEHEEWYKECRGITFSTAHGDVKSRTLHKFQNVGENDSTQPHLIPWDCIVRVMDKRDGSMITPVLLDNGSIVCKTKKTFTSNEAIEATKLLHSNLEQVSWVRSWLLKGYTPTFEFTSPEFPIVLLYDKPELTLLQVRNNVTGEYLVEEFMSPHYFKDCPFPIVPNLIQEFSSLCSEDGMFDGMQVSWDMMREAALTREGIEGWIIQDVDGQMWKIKTKWYCDLHHAVTFTRYRDVAKAVLSDQTDDLKAAFALTGRPTEPIIEIEKKVFADVTTMKEMAESMGALGKAQGLTPAEMAKSFAGDPMMKHIMRAFNGKPSSWNDWLEYYRQRHIAEWPLTVIPAVAQNEDIEPQGEEDEKAA